MKKIRNYRFIFYILIFFLALVGLSTKTSAQNVKGLAIQPVYPSNQIQKNGFLNPKVKPGSTQKLSFNIINFSDKIQKVKVSANTVGTSDTPGLDYSKKSFLNDNKKELNFSQLFKNRTVTKKVKPYKQTKITFEAKIPKEKFSGVIFGGFYIDNNLTLDTKNGGTVLNNKYTYVMPAILREKSTYKNPKLTLGDVKADAINTYPQILSTINNPKPEAIYNMDVNTRVWNENKKKVADQSVKATNVAPNTHFTMRTRSNEDTLNPGRYHIKIIANSDQGKWVLEKDFQISTSQYVGAVLQNNWWLLILIIVLISLLLLLIAYLIYRKYKKNQEKKSHEEGK